MERPLIFRARLVATLRRVIYASTPISLVLLCHLIRIIVEQPGCVSNRGDASLNRVAQGPMYFIERPVHVRPNLGKRQQAGIERAGNLLGRIYGPFPPSLLILASGRF